MTKPKYPVVDPDPSIGRFMANFNFSDYSTIAGTTALGYVVGFFGGASAAVNVCVRYRSGS